MTDEHAPVKFRAGFSPSSAIDAGRIAASKCEAFFGDQPYQITTLEVRKLSTLGGDFIAYEGYVEAVARVELPARTADGTADGPAA